MKQGILEVLIVNAQGIKHTNLFGRPSYFVIAQCGSQIHKTKVSSGKDEKPWWNDKFRFEFPLSDWKKLTHLKLKIMDTELFSDGGFVGESIIHLGGIISEGNERGFIEVKPSPYSVVLEDDTYKGQVQIGFKFIVDSNLSREMHMETGEGIIEENQPRHSICGSIVNCLKFPWWKYFFSFSQINSKNKHKQK